MYIHKCLTNMLNICFQHSCILSHVWPSPVNPCQTCTLFCDWSWLQAGGVISIKRHIANLKTHDNQLCKYILRFCWPNCLVLSGFDGSCCLIMQVHRHMVLCPCSRPLSHTHSHSTFLPGLAPI